MFPPNLLLLDSHTLRRVSRFVCQVLLVCQRTGSTISLRSPRVDICQGLGTEGWTSPLFQVALVQGSGRIVLLGYTAQKKKVLCEQELNWVVFLFIWLFWITSSTNKPLRHSGWGHVICSHCGWQRLCSPLSACKVPCFCSLLFFLPPEQRF